MVSANRFYRMARQKLPIVTKEACNIFSIDNFDTEIVWMDRAEDNIEKLKEGILDYRLDTRKLIFSPKNFFRKYSKLPKLYSKFIKDFTLEHGVMCFLPHEVSHNVHDAKTDYEVGAESMLIETSAYHFNNKESKILSCVCSGIKEAIVDYSGNIILERLNFKDLIDAERKLRNRAIKIALEEDSDITIEEIPNSIDKSMKRSKHFTVYVSEVLQRKFKKEGLESFRKTAEIWRPSQVSYGNARVMLESSLVCLRHTDFQ